MGDKKRKGTSTGPDAPPKKSKKSKGTDAVEDNAVSQNAIDANVAAETKPLPAENEPVVKSKKSRKRASDFLDDEPKPLATIDDSGVTKKKKKKTVTVVDPADAADEPASKKPKKAKNKKSKHEHDELLTADGVNGVVEHSGNEDLETATSHKPVSTSMQAEAERTVDQELEEEFGGFEGGDDGSDVNGIEEADNAAALLAGFDSDSEDNQADDNVDLTTTPALPKAKKTQKKLDKIKAQGGEDGLGTVYVGRIPHGFYEAEMKEYFSQFGDIARLRLSRNKRTGASKHFAFIEFSSNHVAKIVATTMDNYLLFGHILKCKYAEPGSLHPDVWKGADKKFRKIPHEKLEREKLAAPKSEAQWQKKVDKEQRKRDKKAAKMQEIGLDMPTSKLTSPSDVLRQRLANQDQLKQIQDEDAGPTGLVVPSESLPADEVIKKAKKEKKEKKEKKDKKDKKKKASPDPSTKLADPEPVQDPAPNAELQGSEPVPDQEPAAPMEDDFISFDKEDDEAEPQTPKPNPLKSVRPSISNAGHTPRYQVERKEKKEKKKQERKNLVKARGPKSGLVSTKAKSDPEAVGRGGMPLLGKAKYDKAKRQAHKELKTELLKKSGRKSF